MKPSRSTGSLMVSAFIGGRRVLSELHPENQIHDFEINFRSAVQSAVANGRKSHHRRARCRSSCSSPVWHRTVLRDYSQRVVADVHQLEAAVRRKDPYDCSILCSILYYSFVEKPSVSADRNRIIAAHVWTVNYVPLAAGSVFHCFLPSAGVRYGRLRSPPGFLGLGAVLVPVLKVVSNNATEPTAEANHVSPSGAEASSRPNRLVAVRPPNRAPVTQVLMASGTEVRRRSLGTHSSVPETATPTAAKIRTAFVCLTVLSICWGAGSSAPQQRLRGWRRMVVALEGPDARPAIESREYGTLGYEPDIAAGILPEPGSRAMRPCPMRHD